MVQIRTEEKKGTEMSAAYIKLYFDMLEMSEALTDGEFGRLVRGALMFARTGEAPELSGSERILFPALKLQIQRDIASYNEISQKRANASKSKQMITSDNKCLQDKDQDQDQDQDKDKDKDKDQEYTLLSPPARERVDYQAVVELFNSICVSLPSVRSLSDARKKAVSARMTEINGDMDELRHTLELVEQSDFLSGRSGTWQASFDWIFKAANWQKIREGNYKNRGGVNGGDTGGDSENDPWAFLDDSAI